MTEPAYQKGDRVDIWMPGSAIRSGDDEWLPGVVTARSSRTIYVRAYDGRAWNAKKKRSYVVNHRVKLSLVEATARLRLRDESHRRDPRAPHPPPKIPRPLCLYCRKKVQRFPYCAAEWAQKHQREWGSAGDNFFCNKVCGYRFGVAAAKAIADRKLTFAK